MVIKVLSFSNSRASHRSLVGSVLAFIRRKARVCIPGQTSKRNMKKKYFFSDFCLKPALKVSKKSIVQSRC